METITLQIGNTDDKLSQAEWADFYETIDRAISQTARRLHFSGSPPSHDPRQNACWVFDLDGPEESENHTRLREKVAQARAQFRQDSIAWTAGTTELI